MKRLLCLIIICTLIFNVSAIQCYAKIEPEKLYAQAAALIDGDTGRLLFGKNEENERANASTTKIMTLILALEYGNPEDLVLVSSYAAKMPEVSLGIKEGEQYYLKDLLYSLILESHNDTAVAIAEHISGSVTEFAKLMNAKARDIGMNDTYFITPNGLDAYDDYGKHHTTAYDLCLLMRYCVKQSDKKEDFIQICQTKGYSFYDYNHTKMYGLYNRNKLLDIMDGVLAGKTGFTCDAGYCYVAAVQHDDNTYIIALLGCGWPNNKTYKWSDSKYLFYNAFDLYHKKRIWLNEVKLDDIYVSNGIDKAYVKLYTDDYLDILVKDDDIITYTVNLPELVDAPVYINDILGSITVNVNGIPFLSFNVYSQEEVKRVNYNYFLKKIIKIITL